MMIDKKQIATILDFFPGTTARNVAETFMSGGDWPSWQDSDGNTCYTDHGGDTLPSGCRWSWPDSGIRVAPDGTVTAFTYDGHYLTIRVDGIAIDADSHIQNPDCVFWADFIHHNGNPLAVK